MKPKAAFANYQTDFSKSALGHVYGESRRKQLAELADLLPDVLGPDALANPTSEVEALEVIFSTWGMPALTEDQLLRLPNLKAVFYAAGSVQGFARPLLERGVIVTSAWAANALPVAEYTLAQILLSLKRFWAHAANSRSGGGAGGLKKLAVAGGYRSTVGLIGYGMIGRRVAELLKAFELNIIVYDPYASVDTLNQVGIESVSIEALFERSDVVSLHAPNLPATKGMLGGEHFRRMKHGSTFINTARGALVRESELIATLQARPDLWALLDVTDPEPPADGSPFYSLPNVILTPHIAGSMDRECERMADFAIAEFLAWKEGRPLKYAVSLAMLDTMA